MGGLCLLLLETLVEPLLPIHSPASAVTVDGPGVCASLASIVVFPAWG